MSDSDGAAANPDPSLDDDVVPAVAADPAAEPAPREPADELDDQADDADPHHHSLGELADDLAAMPDDLPSPIVRFFSRPTVRGLAAGLLLAASMPPWGFWPLAFIGVALLDRLLAGAAWRSRLFRGSVVGWALFVPTVLWITQLTAPGYVVAVVVLGGLVGAFCILVPPNAGRALGLIGAWILCESLRSAWPFGGVPLSLLAVGQVSGPLAGIARVGGVLGIAGTTVLVGIALSAGFARHYRKAAILAVVAVGVLGLSAVAPSGHNTGRKLDIALVQGGGAQGTRAINTDRRKVFQRHLDASQDVPQGMDLVLWPEDVVDTDFRVQDAQEGVELQDLARQLRSPLIVGTVEGVSDTRFRNSSQVVDQDGNWTDRYVKVQRVPFGEWVPFRSLIEKVAPDTLAARDATISHEKGVLHAADTKIATAISWEIFFAHRVRSGVKDGGELIYNPTNGSTYTGTFVQTQQVASSRLRALESGRWLVQVAPTGFSAYISPTGEVFQRTGTRERAVEVRRNVPLRQGLTWYTQHGDAPMRWLAVILILVGWALDRRQKAVALGLGSARRRPGG